jgi:tRNA (cmo5U34)-methyltransferase
MVVDTVLPDDKWAFDEDVTAAFDDMLARSIPQYTVMREAVYHLACRYIQPHTAVVDLGSSRGEAVAKLVSRYAMVNRFHLTDVSEPMLVALQERFAHDITMNTVRVQACDLRSDFPLCEPSVVLCVLTLQFTPMEYRQQIVQTIYDKLLPGGALLLVEKVLGATAPINQVMVDLYYGMKRDNGYSEEQIQRKRMSLEGVLVPVTARWNEELLQSAGFRQVDMFWRWMNFCGWLAVKDG